ncbi:acyltransferase family protein [Antribacter gilvus]|uniref:acyltransferase family protein n=1 Tax=Antribacter gilvus TaxID=2304675 RepID=UPI000F780598
MTDPAPAAQPSRLASLDGLRGVAALVVLVYHLSLVLPAVAAAYTGLGTPPAPGTAQWYAVYSPLHWLFAGQEAVVVFFVLSGLVVALPAMRRVDHDWLAYYVARVLRLGVPFTGAVLFAVLLVVLVPQVHRHPSAWVDIHRFPQLDWRQVVPALDMVSGTYLLDNALWSIRWEFLFSLLLPLFVVAGVALRRWWPLVGVASVLVTYAAVQSGSQTYLYLTPFLVGTVLAANLPRLQAAAERINRTRARHLVWPLATLAGMTLLSLPWLAGGLGLVWPGGLPASFGPVGAALLIISAIGGPGLRRLLSTRPCQLAGRYSFSLYLIHVPVIMTVVAMWPTRSFPFIALVAGPAALVIAVVFHHLVERPSHTLAQDAARRAPGALRAWVERTAQPTASTRRTTTADASGATGAGASTETRVPAFSVVSSAASSTAQTVAGPSGVPDGSTRTPTVPSPSSPAGSVTVVPAVSSSDA